MTPLLLCLTMAVFAVLAKKQQVDQNRFQDLPFYDAFAKLKRAFGTKLPEQVQKETSGQSRFNAARNYYSSQVSHSPIEKRSNAAGVIDVCSFSMGGYHVILTEYFITPELGALECAKFGWQYAIIPPTGWELASWTISNCTTSTVGVRSYNGFEMTGCTMMQASGVFLLSEDALECAELLGFPLVCQEGPIETVTDTITADSTTTTTTIVTVETPMPKAFIQVPDFGQPNQQIKRDHNKPIDRKELANRRKTVKGRLQLGYDVCTESVGGYHMVFDFFNHADSYTVCEDLGWYLADVSASDIPNMLSLFDACMPFDVVFNVNSYGGLASGLCRLAYFLPWYNVWGIAAINPNVCYFMEAPVICQESPFTATITGGTATSSTVTTTSTLIKPIATSTVTSTVFE